MGRWGGCGRRTVEQTRSVDINELRRAGYVGKPPGNWWVHRNNLYRAGIEPKHWTDKAITLDNQTLRVTYLPLQGKRPIPWWAAAAHSTMREKPGAWHFGGRRAYFLCDCGRRIGKLFAPRGQPWRCRQCYGLTYATRQAVPQQRLLIKAQKIRELLGGSPSMLDDFPAKPKGMHWRRYDHLQEAHDRAANSSLAMLASRVFAYAGRAGS